VVFNSSGQDASSSQETQTSDWTGGYSGHDAFSANSSYNGQFTEYAGGSYSGNSFAMSSFSMSASASGVLVQRLLYARLFSGFCGRFAKSPRGNEMPANAARTGSAGTNVAERFSGCPCEFDERQMTTVGEKTDFELKLHAGLAFDQRLRSGTWRAARPGSSRFESRRAAGGAAPK
jgi:hypothetical protein